jgi:hypothetical protein
MGETMVSTSLQRRLAVLGCMLGLLVLPGCDKGPDQLAKAEAKYSDLIQRGVPPTDPAWDEVVDALHSIPKDSKARPEAERRLAAVEALRGRLPPRPLATPGAMGPGTDAVVAQRAECAKLAMELGRTTEERREHIRQALDACREKLVRLEASAHPPGEGDEHGGDEQRRDAGP